MRLLRRLGVLGSLAAIVAALGVLTAGPVRADTLIGCPEESFVGNVQIDGMDCLIDEPVTVTGNIHIKDGGLFVSGRVLGNIEQEGTGGDFEGAPDASVVVGSSGLVIGHIRESGPDSVYIDGTVIGNITEQDAGFVTLFNVPASAIFGIVTGNIKEEGDGSVAVQSLLNGNVKEKGDGDVFCRGTINGNIGEEGVGSVFIRATGIVNGNVKEKDAGSVDNDGVVNGNINMD